MVTSINTVRAGDAKTRADKRLHREPLANGPYRGTATAVRLGHRTSGALVGLFAAGLLAAATAAMAQSVEPPVAGEVVTPVEIAMGTLNGEVICRPPVARLPALAALELRVLNQAQEPIMFLAPAFFDAAEIVETTALGLEASPDAFIVEPGSAVRTLMRSPPPGEYGYSCFAAGQLPTPKSSGFLVVGAEAEAPDLPSTDRPTR